MIQQSFNVPCDPTHDLEHHHVILSCSYPLTGKTFSHPAGNSRLMSCLNSAASSGYFFSYSAKVAFQAASKAAPSAIFLLVWLHKIGRDKHAVVR